MKDSYKLLIIVSFMPKQSTYFTQMHTNKILWQTGLKVFDTKNCSASVMKAWKILSPAGK